MDQKCANVHACSLLAMKHSPSAGVFELTNDLRELRVSPGGIDYLGNAFSNP